MKTEELGKKKHIRDAEDPARWKQWGPEKVRGWDRPSVGEKGVPLSFQAEEGSGNG